MAELKIAIVGAGEDALFLLSILQATPGVFPAGIWDADPDALALAEAKRTNVFSSSDLSDILSIPGLDVVIDTTGLKLIQTQVNSWKEKKYLFIEKKSVQFFISLMDKCQNNHGLKQYLNNRKGNYPAEGSASRLGKISSSKYCFDDLVGCSKLFQSTKEIGQKAGKCDATVLITGEKGTGKGIYAHAIHNASNRSSRPFVKVDCSFVPENMMEGEIFGYEKGVFPGSVRYKPGKLELANEGILLLHEVGELGTFVQGKLLKFLEDGEFERVGGSQVYQADVRIIATSSRNLKDMIREGLFREDLYFKLKIIEIKIPPLRVRSEDIRPLTEYLVTKFNRKFRKNIEAISPEAMQLLVEYEWPGNVRELESVLERAVVNIEDHTMNTWHLAPYIGQFGSLGSNQSMEVMPLEKMEQILLNTALTRYGDSLEGKKKAAQALNISLATLYNKLRKYKNDNLS